MSVSDSFPCLFVGTPPNVPRDPHVHLWSFIVTVVEEEIYPLWEYHDFGYDRLKVYFEEASLSTPKVSPGRKLDVRTHTTSKTGVTKTVRQVQGSGLRITIFDVGWSMCPVKERVQPFQRSHFYNGDS